MLPFLVYLECHTHTFKTLQKRITSGYLLCVFDRNPTLFLEMGLKLYFCLQWGSRTASLTWHKQMFVSITPFLEWMPDVFYNLACFISINTVSMMLRFSLSGIISTSRLDWCVCARGRVCMSVCNCARVLPNLFVFLRVCVWALYLWACVCVSSRAHCEGVIVEPRPCKLSDSERCCTSKGHAFWAFPVYYKPCNTHQGCSSAPPCPSSSHREKPPF